MSDAGRLGRAGAPLAVLMRVARTPAGQPLQGGHSFRLRSRSALVEFGILLAVITAVLDRVVWSGSMRFPFQYASDALFDQMQIDEIIHGGLSQGTARLGAPYGQQLFDFPTGGDNGNFLIVKALSLFTHNAGTLMNLFWILGFYTTGVAAWIVLRKLGTGRFMGVGLALIFTFLGYHFSRYPHLWLAHYAVIPLAVLLAVRTAQGSWNVRPRRPIWRWVGVIAAVIACGSFGAYYAVFIAITVACMCLISAIAYRTVGPLIRGGLVAGGVLAMLMLNEVGSLLYWATNGSNPGTALRMSSELDAYSLRLADLISPTPGGHLDSGGWHTVLTALTRNSAGAVDDHLGLILGSGLAALVVTVFVRSLRRAGTDEDGVRGIVAPTAIAWVLIASAGGLTWDFWVLGFHNMRAWGRASVLIAFLVAVWLGEHGTLLVRARILAWQFPKRAAVAIVWCAIVMVCVYEQTPLTFLTLESTAAATAQGDQTYFGQVEAALPAGSSVFQLPIREFPEASPTVDSWDYDLVRPYLNTQTLRFSYAGMKGREADWQSRLVGLRGTQLIEAVAAMGFQSIMIDRFGFADRGAALEASITGPLGRKPLVSGDGRWATYPLAGWLAKNRVPADLRARIAGTTILDHGSCFAGGADSTATLSLDCPRQGELTAVTPEPGGTTQMAISVVDTAGPGTLTISADGRESTYSIGVAPTTIVLSVGGQKFEQITFRATTPTMATVGDYDIHFAVTAAIRPIFGPAR